MPRTLSWTSAHTLEQFGGCMALWLEGKLPHMPTRTYYSGVSAETARLVPLLTKLNRSGEFITRVSQPACTKDSREWGGIMEAQRAAVMAYVPELAIAAVRRRLSGLRGVEMVIVNPHSPAGHGMLLVSRHHGKDTSWFGHIESDLDIADHYGGVPGNRRFPGLQPSVIRALQDCYQVTVVDQTWGRNSVLWPALGSLVN